MKDIKSQILDRIAHGRCEVLGLGISNLPLCRWLTARGANIYGRDKKDADALGDTGAELKALGVTLINGSGYLNGIGGDEPQNTVIFRSPGIRPDLPEILEATNAGAILTSEMELFFELTPATVIGVTGSDGKTTTTTVIGELLSAQFRHDGTGRHVYIGGNIGEPLLPLVSEMHPDDFAVVELSSFQLMTMKRSPSRSVITNVTPNHLNWHTGMDEYATAKQNIYLHEPCGLLTVNAEDKLTAEFGASTDIPVTYFSSVRHSFGEIVSPDQKRCSAIFERDGNIIFSDGFSEDIILETKDIFIPGRHNVQNYMAAIAVTYGLVSKEVIKHIAKSFKGVEHRCEPVRELRGVRFYNSSIDSSPTRTAAALSNFAPKKVIIICGGYDKKIPFAPLAEALCRGAKTLVLTGATAPAIKQAVHQCPDYHEGLFGIIEKPDFTEAVLEAADSAVSGDIVILSPACASFDAFRNFEERGKKFKEIVNALV